jgi:outer membrane protein TolC
MNTVPVFVDHVDQGDYAIDQLSFRQTQLNQQREINQLAVDVSNQVVALRQARARHAAARNARLVQEQLMAGEEKKYSLSSSTIGAVVIARQSLAAAGATELAALVAYKHARIALDQVLGETLEKNHVSVANAARFR